MVLFAGGLHGGGQVAAHHVSLATILLMRVEIARRNPQLANLDSARMMIHVVTAKVPKAVTSLLPKRTLQLLRDYSRTHRHPALLFPAEGHDTSIWERPPSRYPRAACGTLFARPESIRA